MDAINYSIHRNELQYNQHNSHIHKTIDEIGNKVDKQLQLIQERSLIHYKDDLINLHDQYRNLQENRNQEQIRQEVLAKKVQLEKNYDLFSNQALQMSTVYQNLKTSLKKCNDYERQLDLEIKYLQKQCRIATHQSNLLDKQMKQIKSTGNKENVPDLSTEISQKETLHSNQKQISQFQRLKTKVEHIKDYINFMMPTTNFIEVYFGKLNKEQFKTQRQKISLMENLLSDKEFKKYLYGLYFVKNQ